MKVTIHQPDFLPWLGFMQRWRASDLLIIYDDAQFIKGGWQNRDRIGTRDGDRWLTVPVLSKGKLGQQIRDVEINYRSDWQRQHRNTLQSYFGKTAHFKTVFPAFEEIYARNHRLLMELNMDLLRWAAKLLDIRTPVVFSSAYPFTTRQTERLLDLLRAVGGTEYLSGQGSKAYLDESLFKGSNLSLVYQEISDVARDFDPGDDLPYSVIQFLFQSRSIRDGGMTMDISVVIPVRDEQDTIPVLVERLVAVLSKLAARYEIIFVTDVNTDRTWEVLKEQRERNRNICLLKLSGSFGHHVAVIAGLEVAKGESVVLMDGDLEMLPEEIPKLYAKRLEGFDVVYGWSRNKNASFIRDLASRAFNKVMSLLSDQTMTQSTDMFRVISRRTVAKILQFGEHEPSLTHIMGLINLPSVGVEVAFARRERGSTKYSFRRQVNFAISSLVSFSTKPIRLIVAMGFCISAASFLFLAVVVIQKIFVRGYGGLGTGTIMVLFTFFGGLQLLAMGVIGEYIGRIFIQSKSRPRYIVEEQLMGDGQKE